MSDFNTLCKKFENSDPTALKDIMTHKLNSAYDELLALPEKEEAGDIWPDMFSKLEMISNAFRPLIHTCISLYIQ